MALVLRIFTKIPSGPGDTGRLETPSPAAFHELVNRPKWESAVNISVGRVACGYKQSGAGGLS